MSNWRKRVDRGFEALARFIFRFRWLTLAAVVLVVVALATQVPKMRMESTELAFFHKNDRTLIDYNEFRDQFGRDEVVIVALTPEKVFDRAFLTKLVAFHDALERRVPYLDEVTSLVNVRDTRGEGDVLVVEDFLENFPESDAALAALEQRALRSNLYRNYLLSEDGQVTSVVIETLAFSPAEEEDELLEGFDDGEGGAPAVDGAAGRVPLTEPENRALVTAVHEVVAEFDSPDFPLHVAGGPVVEVFFNAAMQDDMGKFTMLCLLAIVVLLFLLFRRIAGVVMPMIVVVFSVIATLGLMAVTDTPFTIVTTFLPTFLLAVAVGHSVHLLAVFFRNYQREGDKLGALVYAMGHSGLPILMTGLTTAAGLFAFSRASIRMVGELGIFGGLGVLMGLLFTLVLLPAMIAVWPMRPKSLLAKEHWGERFDTLLRGIADLSVDRPWSVVMVSGGLLVAAVVGLTQLRLSQNFVEWIPKSEPIRQEIDLIDERLKGAMALELVVDTGEENGLYDPELLRSMDSLTEFSSRFINYEGVQLVGKTFSVVDILKETHQALNENRPEFYSIPDDRNLVAQELLLFENSGSEDLEDVVDGRFSMARFTFKTRNDDAARYVSVLADIEAEAQRLIGGQAELTVTGRRALFTSMIDKMMADMRESYLIAGVVITIMMMILIGSFRIGVLSMAVNFLPILITLGLVMGLVTGISLDVHNLVIGSISLGLAVDDTIHFFHNFRRYFAETGNVREAVRQTLLTTGRAMLFTTIVLVLGFWLFMASTLNLNFNFGLLTGLTLIFALLSDFFLAPALLEIMIRTRHGLSLAKRWGAA